MAKLQGFMVEKLSEERIREIIESYTALGWKFHSLGEHGAHRLLTLAWEGDSEPPVPNKE